MEMGDCLLAEFSLWRSKGWRGCWVLGLRTQKELVVQGGAATNARPGSWGRLRKGPQRRPHPDSWDPECASQGKRVSITS